MEIILPILLGIALSSGGVILPGLLNMTAVKISLRDGRQRAVIFSIGATLVVLIQCYIAVTFAKFINRNPDIIDLLQEIGLGIFFVLTIYFIFIAKAPRLRVDNEDEVVKLRSKTGEFFLGVLLSALNFFPIPYYVFVSITLYTYEYFYFTPLYIFLFVTSAVVGTFSTFYLYIIFFKKVGGRTEFLMQNINYIIGSITGLIALITFIRIMQGL